MRYMMLIYSQETAEGPSPESITELKDRHWNVMEEATQKGVLLACERLSPTATATAVRVKDGKAITTDGPFAETKEQLAGFYMLECKNLDDAIEWARKIPTSCRGGEGCVEIRPVADIPKRS